MTGAYPEVDPAFLSHPAVNSGDWPRHFPAKITPSADHCQSLRQLSSWPFMIAGLILFSGSVILLRTACISCEVIQPIVYRHRAKLASYLVAERCRTIEFAHV